MDPVKNWKQAMDQAILSAYEQLNVIRRASVDEILIDPTLRSQFLEFARATIGPILESEALRRLITLRKRKKLSTFR
jgi:hypothetical protein